MAFSSTTSFATASGNETSVLAPSPILLGPVTFALVLLGLPVLIRSHGTFPGFMNLLLLLLRKQPSIRLILSGLEAPGMRACKQSSPVLLQVFTS